jgi:hypothetical protein
MLSQCANIQCSKPFLRLREGKLFVVEVDRATKPGQSAGMRQPRSVEHYWLCDACAGQLTLQYDAERGVALVPLRRPTVGATSTAAVAASAGQSGVA